MTMTSLLWRHSWPGPTSLKIIPVLYKPAYRLPQGTGDGVQVVQDIPGYERWRKICANLILASSQGSGELKTEQLGGHSQEQQRHRQAPIDDSYLERSQSVSAVFCPAVFFCNSQVLNSIVS